MLTREAMPMVPTFPTLRIRLLGTFDLVYGDKQVTGVNTPRQQSVLAYLLLHRDAPQLRQHLAFHFWPDATEAQARNNLRQTLHALRRSLPNADLFLQADTNVLRWRPDAPFQLDVAEFERAVALAATADSPPDGDAPRAALERAVTLYQADLLPSCYDEWIAPERARLRQRYLDALGQLIQVLEDQHDFPAAAGYARRWTTHDPLNEEAYRRLMRLQAQMSDRAGAVRTYHVCAGTLERELGIAPSAETTDAYTQVLRMERASASAPMQRHVASSALTLIGRQRSEERLWAAWQHAAVDGPGFALVTGEAGIGKSRLAEDLLIRASQQGALTAKTRCYAAEGRLSLAPVTDWLRGNGVRRHLGRINPLWLSEVSRLLPEVSAEFPDLPPYEPISEYGQRQRFFEALARAVLAAPQPLLLVIDDLQWCDQETLEWLHFLLRFDASAHLLVVGTARAEEIPPEHPLHTLMRGLHQTASVTEISLQPLDAAEAAKLAAVIAGRSLDEAEAMRLFRETEGNPLFVVETMRVGFDTLHPRHTAPPQTGHAPAADDAPRLPPRVHAVLAARLAQLSPSTRELAALAAAVGREFRLDVLLNASAIAEEAILRALDELWQRRIIREQGANTYDFTHDKLREVAYNETSVPQRRLLHRRIAQALEAIHGDSLDAVSSQIASHYDQAGLADRAIPYYHRAAGVARRVYANGDAIELLSRALALLQEQPATPARDAQELDLLQTFAPIYRVTRGWTAPELEQVTRRALLLCDTVGDDAQRVEVLNGWGSLLLVQAKLGAALQVGDELRTVAERVQGATPHVFDMMLAGAHLHLGQIIQANEMFERMVAAQDGAQVGEQQDSLGWNYAVHTRAWQAHALWCAGCPERALARGQEAIQLARDLVLPFNQALASAYFAMLQQFRADVATVKACAMEADALTVEYTAPYYHAWSAILVCYATAWEQPDATHIARLREAINTFLSSGARLRLPYYLWLLASVCHKAGRVEAGLAALDEATAAAQANNERWWDAELYRLRGELTFARGGGEGEVTELLLGAAKIARAQRARSLELRAATSLVRLSRTREHADQAMRRLRECYHGFTEGFDTPDLHEAHVLLIQRT
jgi:predicted ATPase/DNA-binding SARP family transcriptional activator